VSSLLDLSYQMGRLPFPPDAELTGPDCLVLSLMAKEYEIYGETPKEETADAAEESDDSATKRSEFVAPSPEGNACSLLSKDHCAMICALCGNLY
jgi:hypothetical protein